MKLNELFSEALPIISKFAPTIGAAIGGPFGAAAGYVIPILANSFGVHPTQIKDLVNEIVTNTDSQVKLQTLECEHADWLNQIISNTNNLTNAKIHIELAWQQDKN